ncbi:hypothetical protein OAT08_00520 [Pelagibacteraceae bacterium]|jgi:hypothetical protein|nr:hypothetical protein [Pelagibacteraceae bacterium]
MEQSTEPKIELKNKIIYFFNKNKLKVIVFLSIFTVILISLTFIEINKKKQNSLIAEKYVEAGLLFNLNKKVISRELYEEIILSKNQFYSILALNTIIEKNLISDSKKILEYFKFVENSLDDEDQKDILIFKKSLYLIKAKNLQEGRKLLKKLIQKKSKFKKLAEKVLIE